MLITKCAESFPCDVMLQKAEEKQVTLTICPDMVEDLCGLSDVQLIDDALLDLENVDFTYTLKNIVTKIAVHEKSEDECKTAQDKEVSATQGTEQSKSNSAKGFMKRNQ